MEATEYLEGKILNKDQKKCIRALTKSGFKLPIKIIRFNPTGLCVSEPYRSEMIINMNGKNIKGEIKMYW